MKHNEPIVEKLIIRDNLNYSQELRLTNVNLSQAVYLIDEYCQNKSCNQSQKIWTCRLGWHNFPDLDPETQCKECHIKVSDYQKQKRRLINVKNIIMHIKVNVRRWRDEQLSMIKEIIDKEVERRDFARLEEVNKQ